MKIGIFTGGTSVRSKNIFTDISRYTTSKHEIKYAHLCNTLSLSVKIVQNWSNSCQNLALMTKKKIKIMEKEDRLIVCIFFFLLIILSTCSKKSTTRAVTKCDFPHNVFYFIIQILILPYQRQILSFKPYTSTSINTVFHT